MRFVLAAGAAFVSLAIAAVPSARAAEPVAAAPADAARLAAARQTVDYVFPTGTYARLMNGTIDKMLDSIMDSTMQMPLKDLAGISGIDTENLGEGSASEIMAIYDPAYKERMRVTTHTMMAEMTTLMTQFEPEIRDGLAGAYAARFDAKQLGEMNAFFATPTGKAYAADSYIIMMAPEVMTKMQSFMPKFMEKMPAIVEKMKAANAAFPAPRTYAQLSDAEKTKLASLLGVSRKDLDRKESEKSETQAESTGGD